MEKSKNFIQPLAMLILVLGLTLWIYRELPQTFFQQDEWHAFGQILLRGVGYVWSDVSVGQFLLGSSRPLARLLNYLLFSTFGTNAFWYGIVSLGLHLVNVSLIWIWLNQLIKNRWASSAAALFFGLNNVGSQAVTWYGNMSGTLPATTFLLLSLILYTGYKQKQSPVFLVTSFLSFFTALLFKELVVFLAIFIPIYDLIEGSLSKKGALIGTKKMYAALKRTWVFWGYGGLVIAGRFLGLNSSGEAVGRFVGSGNFLTAVALHVLTYPVEGFFQIVVAPELTFTLARFLGPIWFPFITEQSFNFDLFAENVVSEVISLVGGIILLFVFVTAIIRWWNTIRLKQEARQLFLAICFLSLSFLPYIVLTKPNAYLESRCYYVASAGLAWMTTIFLIAVWKARVRRVIRVSVWLVFALLLAMQVILLRQNLRNLTQISKVRTSFLQQVLSEHPQLQNRTVFFFTERDELSGETKRPTLPFQSGLGHTLMVLYGKKGELEPKFFEDEFLWDIGSQGYKEINGKGYGFFDKLTDVQALLNDNKFFPENLVVYSWNQQTKQLKDITLVLQPNMHPN